MLYFIIALTTFISYFIFVPSLLCKYWPENIESSKQLILKFRILVLNIINVRNAHYSLYYCKWFLWYNLLFKSSIL